MANTKEKAIELYEKFYYLQSKQISEKGKHIRAVDCAIITCDELINAFKEFSIQEHGAVHIDYGHGFWENVKEEIKKI